jgi:hypothetical protein
MAKMEAQSLAELVQMALLVKDEGLAESSS